MSFIHDLVRQIRPGHVAPDFADVVGTYRFDIEDDGSWMVAVDHGAISVREGRQAADCVVACTAADFESIVTGRLNLLVACMQGRLSVEGSPLMVMRLRGSFLAKRIDPRAGG
jgi:putative sterol carrier protein